MDSGARPLLHHSPLLVAAAASALCLGACDPGPSAGKTGKAVDQAFIDGGRGWEQAAAIADENIDRAPGALGEQAATPVTTRGDDALRSRVRSALGAEPGLQALAIDVDTASGAITLYGTADTAARRDQAAQLALKVDGVKSVTNHLIILKGS